MIRISAPSARPSAPFERPENWDLPDARAFALPLEMNVAVPSDKPPKKFRRDRKFVVIVALIVG